MINGQYIFYENNKEIYRSQNTITTFGKKFFTSLISGTASSTTKDLAIGIGTTSATTADTRLEFEFYRLPVTLTSVDFSSSYTAIFKTTIPQDVIGVISEIGLFPGTRQSINNFDSKFITEFSAASDWYTSTNNSTSFTTPTPRIGENVLEFKFEPADTTNTTREYKYNIGQLDISGYSAKDTLSLAYNRASSNLTSIKVKFYSSSGNYYYGTFTPGSGTGNKITTISMSDVFSNTYGTPIASSISIIGIELTRSSAASSATAYMDGLRINDDDTFDPNLGLISRSVLGSSITKSLGRAIDIEYKINLDF